MLHRGRKPTKSLSVNPEDTFRFTVSVPAKELFLIDKLAKASGKSRSQIAAHMLRDGMNEADKVMELLESKNFLKAVLIQFVRHHGTVGLLKVLYDVDDAKFKNNEDLKQEIISEVKSFKFKEYVDRLLPNISEHDRAIQ